MNDVIHKLAVKAGLTVGGSKDFTYVNFDHEAFARALVNECSQALWTEECHTSDLAYVAHLHNIQRLKDHFGAK